MRRVCMTSQRLTCFARLASFVENLSEDVLPPAGLLVVFFTLIASRAHASSPIPQPQLRMGSSPGLSTCQSLQCFPIPNTAAAASSPIPLGGRPPLLWHFCSSFRAHSITKEINYSDHNSWNSLRICLIRLTRLCKSCKHAFWNNAATIAGKFHDGFFALSSTHQPSNIVSSTRICVKK